MPDFLRLSCSVVFGAADFCLEVVEAQYHNVYRMYVEFIVNTNPKERVSSKSCSMSIWIL
jgi:hypothetical protein